MNKMCEFMLQKTHQTWKYLQILRKIPKFNKRRAFNKAVGPGKKYKINKRRAYIYSGLKSILKQIETSKNIHVQMWTHSDICRYIFFEDGNKLKLSFEIKPPLHESIIRCTDNGAKKVKSCIWTFKPKRFQAVFRLCILGS